MAGGPIGRQHQDQRQPKNRKERQQGQPLPHPRVTPVFGQHDHRQNRARTGDGRNGQGKDRKIVTFFRRGLGPGAKNHLKPEEEEDDPTRNGERGQLDAENLTLQSRRFPCGIALSVSHSILLFMAYCRFIFIW